MKKMIKWALGICALGIASLAATSEASAQTWSNSIPYNSLTQWYDGTVTGIIITGTTNSLFYTTTSAGNAHVGGYFVQCVNQQLWGWPNYPWPTWYGGATRYNYYCPGGNYVSSSYGWIWDN